MTSRCSNGSTASAAWADSGFDQARLRAVCAGLEPRKQDPGRGRGLGRRLRRLAIPALIAPLRTVRNSQAPGLSGVVDCAASFTNASWTTSSGSSHHCRA